MNKIGSCAVGAVEECHTSKTIASLNDLNINLRNIAERIEKKKEYYHGNCPIPCNPTGKPETGGGAIGVLIGKLSESHALSQQIADMLSALEQV